jgi:hypothetical protein
LTDSVELEYLALKDGVEDVHKGDGGKVDGEEGRLPRVGINDGEGGDGDKHEKLADLKPRH